MKKEELRKATDEAEKVLVNTLYEAFTVIGLSHPTRIALAESIRRLMVAVVNEEMERCISESMERCRKEWDKKVEEFNNA